MPNKRNVNGKQIIEITISLLNLTLWQCAFDSRRREDRQQSEIQFIIEDLSLKYWRFNAEIHRFHNIQSEICQNTEEIQRFKRISWCNIGDIMTKYKVIEM